jgi:hypothetical protein
MEGRAQQGATAAALCRGLLGLAFSLGPSLAQSQNFFYVEPGLASCPAAPMPSSATPNKVAKGVAVPGRLSVQCGFDQGSYTVSLSSSDPDATFVPKTFVVNFGQVVGKGVFAVRFSAIGVQTVSATITPNMGSPAVGGKFLSSGNAFEVVLH